MKTQNCGSKNMRKYYNIFNEDIKLWIYKHAEVPPHIQ